jgi:DinB superfamily
LPVARLGVILGSGIPRRETEMKIRASLFVAAVTVILMAAQVAAAQQAAPAASTPPAGGAAPDMTPVANPVSGFVKAGVARYGKNMVAAAEAMPAEKYGFKPSPEMNSYGHLMMHIAETNNTVCAKISGQPEPDVKLAETDAKDKLVAAVKDSFAFCTAALEKVDDSKLGEQFVLFGKRPISRGGALVVLNGTWTDHYATQAIYLRLNGILPPTAQPEKK